MWVADCRDLDDPGDSRRDWRDGKYVWTNWGEVNGDPWHRGSDDVIINIHGFNTEPSSAKKAFNLIHNHQASLIDVRGFTWPSEGKPFRYYSDIFHARKSGPALRKLVLDLKERGYKRVSLKGYSMGGYLLIYALDKYFNPGEIHRVVLEGADVARFRFKRHKRWGLVWGKIDKLRSYYSKHDRVLDISHLVRPYKRIGECKMPSMAPPIYNSVDANIFSNKKVRHKDYKYLGELQQDGAKFCSGGSE